MPTKTMLLATALSVAVITPSYALNQIAPAFTSPVHANFDATSVDANIVRVKNDKDNGKNNGKAKGAKQHKAKKNDAKVENRASKDLKKAEKDERKEVQQAAKDQRKYEKQTKRPKRSNEDRVMLSERLMTTIAPQNRDMTTLLAAIPLALLGQNVIFQDVDEDRLLTYRNCPPGLAKKDPPCVPPGLVEDGVTYDEWVSYDDDRIERVYQDRRDRYLNSQDIVIRDDIQIDDSAFLLNSDQVARLYNMSPAPRGQQYALIDGMPVLLEDRNYATLAQINDMARVPLLDNGVQIAPTAALTQAELMQSYRLPPSDPGYSYSVLNGEVLALENDAFEQLQLIRIARAVF
jgi:Skp family chaperone for outer membrane proteins